MTKLAEVHTIHEQSLCDVPAMLRVLANGIEKGEYGAVGTCVVALFANQLAVFSYGPDSAGASTHFVLSAACRLLEQPLLDHDNR